MELKYEVWISFIILGQSFSSLGFQNSTHDMYIWHDSQTAFARIRHLSACKS